jgi:hypothetical protein
LVPERKVSNALNGSLYASTTSPEVFRHMESVRVSPRCHLLRGGAQPIILDNYSTTNSLCLYNR